MIKLTIYGRLRKFIGQSEFFIKAKSAKEAFSFLINNFPQVKEHMKDQEYCVMAGDLRITEQLLDMQTESDIKIIPVVHGEIFGAIIGLFGGAITSIFTSGVIKSALTIIGTNLIVSGITNLITPDPKPFNQRQQEDPRDQSFIFTGLLNNTKQGVPINIVYGEMLVGSTVVSSSVDTFQVVNEA